MTDLSSLTLRRLRAWIRLLRFVRGAESQLREFLRINFDTTLPRFDVAAALYRVSKPVRMSELSKMLLVSNGNVTTVVDRLEKEGKARRIADETDKRVVSVELTEDGRNWFKDVAAAHSQEVDRIFEKLGHEDLSQLRNLISMITRTQN